MESPIDYGLFPALSVEQPSGIAEFIDQAKNPASGTSR